MLLNAAIGGMEEHPRDARVPVYDKGRVGILAVDANISLVIDGPVPHGLLPLGVPFEVKMPGVRGADDDVL